MANTKKLILDVDTGIDDAIGILLAVKSKQFDILGITTVCGNVSVGAATLNTCKVLELVDAVEIPVIKGAAAPLLRAPHYEHRVHGEDGIGGALKDAQPKKKAAAGFAPDFIIEQVLKYSKQVTLVLTGPLTNLALALKKCPELIHHVKEVIFMGGVVQGQGERHTSCGIQYICRPRSDEIGAGGWVPFIDSSWIRCHKAGLVNG